MFDYKIFKTGNEIILAISDSSIVGKKFSEGKLILEAKRDFYGGNKCGEKEVIKLVKSSTIVNAVGNDIVGLLLKNKLVDEDRIITIGKTKHAQIVVMK